MKTILIILMLSPFFTPAQQYTEAVDLTGTPRGQIIAGIMEPNSPEYLKNLRELNNKLTGKGVAQVEWMIDNSPVMMNVQYKIDAQYRDHKYFYEIKSSTISTPGGESYTYEALKKMGTVEGLKKFYKDRQIPAWMIGKKKFVQNLESNRELTVKVEQKLHEILDGVTKSMEPDIALN